MRDKSHEADGSSPVDQVYAPLHLHEKNDQGRSSTFASEKKTRKGEIFGLNKQGLIVHLSFGEASEVTAADTMTRRPSVSIPRPPKRH
jgi:hypothetical protein